MSTTEHQNREINVRVVSTAGNYPAHGHERVPVVEQIAAILERAADKLTITNPADWVAKIDGKVIDPAQTYEALGLHGEVKIDYGRREGGGGGHASRSR